MKLYYCIQFELFFLLSPFVFLGHSNLKWAQTAHFRVTSFLDPNNRISNITIRSKLVNPIAAWVCYFQHAVHNHIQYLLYILVYCTISDPFSKNKKSHHTRMKKDFLLPYTGVGTCCFLLYKMDHLFPISPPKINDKSWWWLFFALFWGDFPLYASSRNLKNQLFRKLCFKIVLNRTEFYWYSEHT